MAAVEEGLKTGFLLLFIHADAEEIINFGLIEAAIVIIGQERGTGRNVGQIAVSVIVLQGSFVGYGHSIMFLCLDDTGWKKIASWLTAV